MPPTHALELTQNRGDCELRSEAFFCNLSPAALRSFEALKYSMPYSEGAVLFLEGQPSPGIFVVSKGRVKLSVRCSEGRSIILRIAGPGDVLGLNATVSGTACQSTAETLEPCEMNFVGRDSFLRFLHEYGEASLRAAQQLSADYNGACEQIRSLGLAHSAPQKLARFLLDWSQKGLETKRGTRVRLTLKHEEIGQIIGTTRETVTRTLGEFKGRKLITLHGSTLVIEDRPALENCAGLN